jgi:hypothetical protein
MGNAHSGRPDFGIGYDSAVDVPQGDLCCWSCETHATGLARAHDRRDGAAMGALFTPDARVTIFYNNNPDGLLQQQSRRGAGADRGARRARGDRPGDDACDEAGPAARVVSHNATDGLLVDLDGDRATVDRKRSNYQRLQSWMEEPDPL